MLNELRFAIRGLARTPGFTAVAIFVIAAAFLLMPPLLYVIRRLRLVELADQLVDGIAAHRGIAFRRDDRGLGECARRDRGEESGEEGDLAVHYGLGCGGLGREALGGVGTERGG